MLRSGRNLFGTASVDGWRSLTFRIGKPGCQCSSEFWTSWTVSDVSADLLLSVPLPWLAHEAPGACIVRSEHEHPRPFCLVEQ